MTRYFPILVLTALSVLSATAQQTLYDLSGKTGLGSIEASVAKDNDVAKITFPNDWASYTIRCIASCTNGTVAIRQPGSAQFTEYYAPGSLLWAHFDSAPPNGQPVSHDLPATDRSMYLAFKCPYAASYSNSPCPTIQLVLESSIVPVDSSSGIKTTLIWTVVIIFGIWLIVKFFRWLGKQPIPAVSEPTSDPILAPASPISSFEESISTFSVFNQSSHALMDVPPNGKTLLILGLPEDHNSEENQNKIAEQVRQLLSKAPGEITPYQVPHQETYEQAIRGELSAFVGSMGIPTYFYGLEILPTDSIPLGLRQDCEEDGLIIDTIPYSERKRHVYATGMSGSGKSTLLKALALKDIQHHKGIAVIDPHGDLAEDILNMIPKDQADRAIYISADNAIPINFMSYGKGKVRRVYSGQRQPEPACLTPPITSNRRFLATSTENRSTTSLTSGLSVSKPPGEIPGPAPVFSRRYSTLWQTGIIRSASGGGMPRVTARFCWGSPSMASTRNPCCANR